MKILNIGDVHGRTKVFDIIRAEMDNVDLINITGDFFSTHDPKITQDDQIMVMEGILSLKEDFGDKMHIQRGNHDLINYSWGECYPTAGQKCERWMQAHLKEWLDATEWINVVDNIIFSHAGISRTWFKNTGCEKVEDINKLPPSKLFGFTPDNSFDYYGNSKTQPCTWIRPQTLMKDALIGYIQVIGHTSFKQIVHIINDFGDIEGYDSHIYDPDIIVNPVDIWCCDTNLEQYLLIDNGKFIVKNI